MISYRILYALGVTPWERMAALPLRGQVEGMFAREEEGRTPPYGRALDLGCGSGTWSVELAKRGWEVTGIDLVAKPLRAARERAEAAGVLVRFMEGDVTALERTGVGAGYRLLLDFGLVHGLGPARREAVAAGVDAVAAEEASLLMLAFTPGRRGPMPRGLSRQEIEDTYRGWTITDDSPQDMTGAPALIRRAAPRWYRLRRGARSAG